MTQITTTENKTYSLPDSFLLAIANWNLKIEFHCNESASQQKPIIGEVQQGDEKFVLRGYNGRFFLEYYKGKTMYPAVYKVQYTPKPVAELTEDDYQKWLSSK